jgi:signal transduction histidine kinase
MARWRIWLLPALLAAAQLAWWPGLVLARGDTVEPVRAAAVIAVVAVVTAALGLRRRAPVAVTAAVAAGISLGTWVTPGVHVIVPGVALLVVSITDLVALFSVAALRSRRTTVLVSAGLVLWQAVLLATEHGFAGDYPLELLISAVVYAIVAASGRIRRRWVADRAAAARRLAEAQEARQEAAAAERRRLARELHDVTAHHLTSIVVHASAAQLLGDRRPELRAEALDFAARTGRDTLVALRRLVAILPFGEDLPAPAVPSIADLADDFRQLGQVVTVETAGDPPPEVAEAMHGIAREALTNTLRYAPGGTVRLRFSYGPGGAELVVDDDGDGGRVQATAGLGGGRGLTGMRDRAQALGGTLEAGPRGPVGWRVRAVLPPAASVRDGSGRRPRRWLRSQAVLDAGLVFLTLVLPLAGVAVLIEDDDVAPTQSALVLLAVVAHSVPLLWRRQHPWPVLAAVALTTWLGPLLMLTRVAPGDGGWLFVFSVCADMAAVYAVAARTRPHLSWLAAAVTLASTALALGVLVAIEPSADAEASPGEPLMFAAMLGFMTVAATVVLVLPLGGSWLAGYAAQRRRQGRLDREEGAVAVAAAQAELRARGVRARVAAGLRDAVVEHAARVPRAAEEADLAAVVGSAREALAAMRALLDGLTDRPAGGTTVAPPPALPEPVGAEQEVSSSRSA